MKANRKFLNNDDEAVSPVIAVILMVAITVVLAATVYVWVSGFGSGGGNTPAHTMSITSGGAITFDGTGADHWYKVYTVSSADPSLTYGGLTLTINGVTYEFQDSTVFDECDSANSVRSQQLADAQWGACQGDAAADEDSLVGAGNQIMIRCDEADVVDGDPDANCLTGADLIFLDTQANSIMVTLKVR